MTNKTSPKFLGFLSNDLPVKPGECVTIKKGTQIRTTHPTKGPTYVAGTTYKVKVHHFMSGMYAGVVYEKDDCGKPVPQLSCVGSTLLSEIRKVYGTDDLSALETHIIRKPNGDYCLPLSVPHVVWAGAGGYWCEVDVNVIPELVDNKIGTC